MNYHPCPNCGHELQKYIEGAATVTRCPECKTLTDRQNIPLVVKIVADASEFEALKAMIEKDMRHGYVAAPEQLTWGHYGSLLYEASKLTPAVGAWVDGESARESKRRERDIIDAARWTDNHPPVCQNCGRVLIRRIFQNHTSPYVVGNIVMSYCPECMERPLAPPSPPHFRRKLRNRNI